MRKYAEKYFFRYDANDKGKITNETYTLLSYYLLDYEKFIEKKPTKFISYLTDMPEPIFSFYYHLMLNSLQFNNVLNHPDISLKLSNIKQKDVLLELNDILDDKEHITYCFPLLKNALLISLKKDYSKFNHTIDFLIFVENGELTISELNNDFRKYYAVKDVSFSKCKKLLYQDISAFKEKQRLALLFS